MPPRNKRVWFIHPDLGIGGAERLVVDAALALQKPVKQSSKQSANESTNESTKQRTNGSASQSTNQSIDQSINQSLDQCVDVTIFTSHHDRAHCFQETLKQIDVRVIGDWLPQSINGSMKILCSILRSLYLSFSLTCQLMFGLIDYPDVVIIDQLSISVPIFRYINQLPVIFYCHFPDLMLAKRDGWMKRLYRMPFDWVEAITTKSANMVMVNSQFTLGVYNQAFNQSINQSSNQPIVVYPSIKFDNYQSLNLAELDKQSINEIQPLLDLDPSIKLFVSINRFERKKNIGLAIQAFALLLDEINQSKKSNEDNQSFNQSVNQCKLIVAGGYDPINPENVEYLPELERLCDELKLSHSRYPILDQSINQSTHPSKNQSINQSINQSMSCSVIFLPSFSNTQRQALLDRSRAILYTPTNEHFGIVPIEAMYAKRVPIACNSGGPVESINQSITGFLCEPQPQAFKQAMRKCVEMTNQSITEMGEAGRQRVIDKFGEAAFSHAFRQSINQLPPVKQSPIIKFGFVTLIGLLILLIYKLVRCLV